MPTIAPPVGPPNFPEPATADKHDLDAYNIFLWRASSDLQVPYELLVAQSFQESQWHLNSYRYEPNYDFNYISRSALKPGETVSPFQRWSKSAAWKGNGPTIAEWFTDNPARAAEQKAGRDYRLTAQTRISASYGPMQVMYPTAVNEGYAGTPEDLWKPENVVWPLKYLGSLLKVARTKFDEKGALKVALARYNGGAYGNNSPIDLNDFAYVQFVEKRYRTYWGEPFFADVALPTT